MDRIILEGGRSLEGKIRISGSKNAALPMLISALLADGESVFYNVPRLGDVINTISLLKNLGVSVKFEENVVEINPAGLNTCKVSYDLAIKMRASILILGPLLARFREALVPLPGGCSIGDRPIELHLKALKKLGASIKVENGYIKAFAKKLKGIDIYFDIPTVTGTENLIMASVLSEGTTVLRNVACEPEIVALSKALNRMGAKIYGAGSSKIIITGVNVLYPRHHTVIPDRIEAGTFMVASVLTRGDVTIEGCIPGHLESVTRKLNLVGAKIDVGSDNIRVRGTGHISNIDLKTLPYPGFPTDIQPMYMTLMAVSRGLSVVHETIFENRFVHVEELRRMGADIIVVENIARIKGVPFLFGTKVTANDLRASAALILAGLVAKGRTEINKVFHLDRGYECMEEKIEMLGGSIKRLPS